MKKLLLSICMATIGLFASAQSAKTYTDDLVVTINEESTEPQKTDIIVTTNEDGTYNLSLNNFMLVAGEDYLPVGNIALENIEAEENDGIVTFSVKQVINILPGDIEEIGEDSWLGPILGEVPIELTAKLNDTKLYCVIDIDMLESLGQIINVVFGTDDFETNGSAIQSIHDNTVTVVDVYTLQGVCVRNHVNAAEATDGLPKGIYIVNGKKVVKK